MRDLVNMVLHQPLSGILVLLAAILAALSRNEIAFHVLRRTRRPRGPRAQCGHRAALLVAGARVLGTRLLASAGIAGVVIGIAARPIITNLLAGMQILFSEAIRLDDVVVVQGQWGRVEEITFTNVLIRIWDDRRLLLPISYFVEQPFENWTRASASLLTTVHLSVDYMVPVEAVREELHRILERSLLWDHRTWNLQVAPTRGTISSSCAH